MEIPYAVAFALVILAPSLLLPAAVAIAALLMLRFLFDGRRL